MRRSQETGFAQRAQRARREAEEDLPHRSAAFPDSGKVRLSTLNARKNVSTLITRIGGIILFADSKIVIAFLCFVEIYLLYFAFKSYKILAAVNLLHF